MTPGAIPHPRRSAVVDGVAPRTILAATIVAIAANHAPMIQNDLHAGFTIISTLLWIGADRAEPQPVRGTARVQVRASETSSLGGAAPSGHHRRAGARACGREERSSDGYSKDPAWALRSVAEVGLSARTHETRGHCSNAGGLSAVRRHQLYSIRRCRIFAEAQMAQRILAISPSLS